MILLIFQTTLLISLFCVGFKLVTEDGMLLYFLHKPFENLHIDVKNNAKKFGKNSRKYKLSYFKWYVMKPIILCVTCFASVWGSLIWVSIYGFHFPIQWVITIVSASYLNTLLWHLLKKFQTWDL